ncbi:HNH endonuclease [Bacteriovoracales bacterium]|nr:HNH endonuclease [Bacteriovoracales bacterium]
MRTLLLDSMFYPLRVVNWQKAMILFITGRAEVVDEYEEIKIRSISMTFRLPKILRLLTNYTGKRQVKFNRANVYWRDNYCCQYCSKNFSHKELTFDHVMPKSKGGDTTWENVVTCCQKCNSKKGNLLLDECHMRLLKEPIKPPWAPQLCIKLTKEDPKEWWYWIPWISSA